MISFETAWIILVVFLAVETTLRFVTGIRRRFAAPGRFGLNLESMTLACFICLLLALAALDAKFWVGRPTVATVSAGLFLCSLGWLVRYPLTMSWPQPLERRFWQVRRNAHVILNVRHPRYVGLIATVLGLAGVLGSPIGVILAVAIVPLIVVLARSEEMSWMSVHPRSRIYFVRPDQPILLTTRGPLVPAIGLASLLYVLIGLLTHELALFNSDGQTARNLLLALAGAQGTWAILALTLTLVGVQIVASSYSPALTRGVGIKPALTVALAFLVASAAFDVIVVARSGDWIDSHPERGATLVDFAILTSALCLAVTGATALASLKEISPEHVAGRVLRRFDRRWLDDLPQHWPMRHRHPVAGTGDPGRDLAVVLGALVERNDVASLRLILFEFSNRLVALGASKQWPAVDAYLHASLGSVVRLTARQLDDDALKDWLVVLIRPLTESAEWGQAPDYVGFGGEPPDGDLLLFEITEVAVRNARTEAAKTAMYQILRRVESVLRVLPGDEDTLRYRSDPTAFNALTEQERSEFYRKDSFSRVVTNGYLAYLESMAKVAVSKSQDGVVGSAAYVMSHVITAAITQLKESPNQRKVTVSWGLGMLRSLAAEANKAGMSDAVQLSLYYGLEQLDIGDPEDSEIVDRVAEAVKAITLDAARAGRLNYGHTLELSMVSVIGARASASAARVAVDGLVEALAILEESGGSVEQENREFLIGELRSRIDQVATTGVADDETKRKAKEALSPKRVPETPMPIGGEILGGR